MLLRIILLYLVTICAASAQLPPVSTLAPFKVGQVPSDKFPREKLLQIFESTSQQYLDDGAGGALHLGAIQLISTKVFQTIAGNEYIIEVPTPRRTAKPELYHIINTSGEMLVDGSPVAGFLVDNGAYDYTTVLNASKRIQSFLYASASQPGAIADYLATKRGLKIFTQDSFVAYLKSGKTFPLVSNMEKCRKCYGRGEIDNPKKIELGNKVPCPECSGLGSKYYDYEVTW